MTISSNCFWSVALFSLLSFFFYVWCWDLVRKGEWTANSNRVCFCVLWSCACLANHLDCFMWNVQRIACYLSLISFGFCSKIVTPSVWCRTRRSAAQSTQPASAIYAALEYGEEEGGAGEPDGVAEMGSAEADSDDETSQAESSVTANVEGSNTAVMNDLYDTVVKLKGPGAREITALFRKLPNRRYVRFWIVCALNVIREFCFVGISLIITRLFGLQCLLPKSRKKSE